MISKVVSNGKTLTYTPLLVALISLALCLATPYAKSSRLIASAACALNLFQDTNMCNAFGDAAT
jgi:hypothetical protein